MSQRLTAEEIERLKTDLSHRMTTEEWWSLCDMALRSLQIPEEPTEAKCTLCSSEPSPGFYTGCMIKDGAAKRTGWECDGKGNLTRTDRAMLRAARGNG